MVTKFVQLKKRAVVNALLYAALMGACAAALLFGGLFLFVKLTARELAWYWYLLGCLGGFLSVGGLLLAFTYPTTKRYAKYLDETYRLGEKVRTAVEFGKQEGVVLDLQREQTEQALSSLPKRKKGWVWAVKLFLAPALAVAVLTTSLLVPAKKKAEPPYQEPLYQTTLYNVKDLQQLIDNIKASALPETRKEVYLAGLNGLLALIQTEAPTQREVVAAVNSLMLLMITTTREENSYNAVVAAAKEQTALSAMVTALNDSGKGYQSVEGVSLYSYATLTGREKALLEVATATWTEYIESISTDVTRLEVAEYVAYANEYVNALDEVLADEKVKALADTDGVKRAITAIRTGFYESADRLSHVDDNGETYGGKQFATVKAETLLALEDTYNVNEAVNGVETLGKQAYGVMIKDYALQTLSNIFSVPIPAEGTEEGGGDDAGGGSGGGGSGSMEYPDDGLVLDPTDGQYKPYWLLLADYYKKVTELMEANEEMSEELKAYIKAYFEGLQTKEN